MITNFRAMALTALCLGLGAPSAGCGDNQGAQTPDAMVPDSNQLPPCVTNPRTHEELINACTTADVEKIDKRPTLPLLNQDGTLPPLP